MRQYILPLLLLSFTFAAAQSKKEQKADQLYDSYQYAEAIEAYSKLANKSKTDDAVHRKLADSYYMLAQYKDAAVWYGKLSNINDAEVCYRYVQSLRATGKTTEAKQYMDRFVQLAPRDARAIAYKDNPNYLANLQNAPAEVSMLQSELNSKDAADFSAVLSSDNKAYFVSNRGGGKNDSWSDASYVSIYTANLNADGTYTKPQVLNNLKSKYHDGPVTLSSDGKTMFFARDGHAERDFKKNKKNKVKVGQQGIYKAVNENDSWKVVEAMPFNNKEYSVTHPAISSDGKTLYFSSDMPGSIGTSDIWKVTIQPNGSYGKPENLGNKINSPGREVFPFITNNEVLYFASDGHLGMGGLDLYKVDLKNNGEVINLGAPYNSSQDDFGYSEQGEKAYLSSNRAGKDNIYEASVLQTIDINLLIVDASNNNPLSDATINWNALIDSPEQATRTTDASGEITTELNLNTTYALVVSKTGYETTEYTLDVNEETPTHKISMNKVVVEDKEKEIVKAPIVFEDIYFAFDSAVITNAAAAELDQVVRILKGNKDLRISIQSHTDAIGASAYNQALSERRAKATQQYIVAKGIDASRISTKGLGSANPKVKCEEPCSIQDRAQNRRSQITIE